MGLGVGVGLGGFLDGFGMVLGPVGFGTAASLKASCASAMPSQPSMYAIRECRGKLGGPSNTSW